MTAKLTKAEVHYGPGKESSHCGNCAHFIPGANPFGDASCEIVIGPVRWHRWCTRWKAASGNTGLFEGTDVSAT